MQRTLLYVWHVSTPFELHTELILLDKYLYDPSTAPRAIGKIRRRATTLSMHEEAMLVLAQAKQVVIQKADGVDKVSVRLYDTKPALAGANAKKLYDKAMKTRHNITQKFQRDFDRALPVDLCGPIEIQELLAHLAEEANHTLAALNSLEPNLQIVSGCVQNMAATCHTLHLLTETPQGVAWSRALVSLMDLTDELPALDNAIKALARTSTAVLNAVGHLDV